MCAHHDEPTSPFTAEIEDVLLGPCLRYRQVWSGCTPAGSPSPQVSIIVGAAQRPGLSGTSLHDSDVIICFAGETDDYRKIAPQFDQGDPAINAGAEMPLRATVLIVRLPCGKCESFVMNVKSGLEGSNNGFSDAILSSSLPGPAAPVCMVLSKNTAIIVSKVKSPQYIADCLLTSVLDSGR